MISVLSPTPCCIVVRGEALLKYFSWLSLETWPLIFFSISDFSGWEFSCKATSRAQFYELGKHFVFLECSVYALLKF